MKLDGGGRLVILYTGKKPGFMKTKYTQFTSRVDSLGVKSLTMNHYEGQSLKSWLGGGMLSVTPPLASAAMKCIRRP